MKHTKVCDLLGIEFPLIQGGMVWASGANLAAATSNAGCLGVIGSGSMKPAFLHSQILKARALTDKPIAVNIPILFSGAQEQIDIALKCGIKIFITSAGSPKKFTKYLKDNGCIVMHVTSTPSLAKKCEDAGVDAIIVEGFEAGGHNGRDEITSMVLIPQVADLVKIPVIAAGGFADGRGVLAGFALGADGIQMGTRFLMTKESSVHDNFKKLLLTAKPDSTSLSLKEHVPVRLFKNKFYEEINKLEQDGADISALINHLGKGRAKLGMLDGDLEEGELEIGQICSMIKDLPTVDTLIKKLVSEYAQATSKI